MNLLHPDWLSQAVVSCLLPLLDFTVDQKSQKLEDAMPCLEKRLISASQCGYFWRFPSTGCENADDFIGAEMALAYLVFKHHGYGDGFEPDFVDLDLQDISEAMKNGGASAGYVQGFNCFLCSYISESLNRPSSFERLRARIKKLTPDIQRYRCAQILAGIEPPSILAADDAVWGNGLGAV